MCHSFFACPLSPVLCPAPQCDPPNPSLHCLWSSNSHQVKAICGTGLQQSNITCPPPRVAVSSQCSASLLLWQQFQPLNPMLVSCENIGVFRVTSRKKSRIFWHISIHPCKIHKLLHIFQYIHLKSIIFINISIRVDPLIVSTLSFHTKNTKVCIPSFIQYGQMTREKHWKTQYFTIFQYIKEWIPGAAW